MPRGGAWVMTPAAPPSVTLTLACRGHYELVVDVPPTTSSPLC
jgi:hypothetical protein